MTIYSQSLGSVRAIYQQDTAVVNNKFNHRDQMTHISLCKHDRHWFIIIWDIENKFLWNVSKYIYMITLIQVNEFENDIGQFASKG